MQLVRILAVALAASTIAGAAQAADLPSRKAPQPVYVAAPAPIFTWTGFYIGLNGGGWFNDSRFNSYLGGGNSLGGAGGLVGGTVGYNWQMGNGFVAGLEADLDYRTNATVNPPYSNSVSTNDGYLGTARVRLGYGINRALIYITGGLAVGNAAAPNSFGSAPYGFYVTRNGSPGMQAGWTVGAGGEYAVTPNWSIKAEYLYADLGSKGVAYTDTTWATTNVNLKTADHIARVGVNYHFNFGGAPGYAKY